MCTVAFVPRAGRGYLLGHNRDERPVRAPGEPPAPLVVGARRAIAPRDPEAGGTWIGVNDAGLTVCILNAAEADPSRLPEVPRSRGLIVRDLLGCSCVPDVRRAIESAGRLLEETRAFHVVAAEPGGSAGRFRWDGRRHAWDETDRPALYVSSLRFPHEVERERGARWLARVAEGAIDAEALAGFLAGHEPARGPLSVCMHREDAGTVSRTLVEVAGGAAVMRYRNGPPCAPDGPELAATLPLV